MVSARSLLLSPDFAASNTRLNSDVAQSKPQNLGTSGSTCSCELKNGSRRRPDGATGHDAAFMAHLTSRASRRPDYHAYHAQSIDVTQRTVLSPLAELLEGDGPDPTEELSKAQKIALQGLPKLGEATKCVIHIRESKEFKVSAANLSVDRVESQNGYFWP